MFLKYSDTNELKIVDYKTTNKEKKEASNELEKRLVAIFSKALGQIFLKYNLHYYLHYYLGDNKNHNKYYHLFYYL